VLRNRLPSRRGELIVGIGFIAAVAASIGLATLAHAEEDEVPTLESVMQALARSGGVEARFHESRQLTILSEPIKSSGMLYFSPPDWLARHVTEPGAAKVIVRDDRVSFQDETGIQTLELGSSEVARAMVGNVIVLMRGDLAALRSQYEVEFSTSGGLWTLDLEPRDRVVRQLIERLEVIGQGDQLVRMQSIETSGDVTLTEFEDVKVGVEFSSAAREAIFSIRGVGLREPSTPSGSSPTSGSNLDRAAQSADTSP
jgi:outer membrane lipoprotein-sorting protein